VPKNEFFRKYDERSQVLPLLVHYDCPSPYHSRHRAQGTALGILAATRWRGVLVSQDVILLCLVVAMDLGNRVLVTAKLIATVSMAVIGHRMEAPAAAIVVVVAAASIAVDLLLGSR